MPLEYDRTAPVLDNTQVDNIAAAQTGVIDQFAALDFDMSDRDITRNLDLRINDSDAYWNDPKGFDLKNARNSNTRWFLGKVDETGLYKHQKQYKENQIFVGEESIVAYVTSQIAGPLVLPGSKDPKDKLFCSDIEKGMKSYFGGDVLDSVNLERLNELWTRDILNKRLAVGYFYYDKELDEIVLEHVDPEHVIVDKNTALGKNPGFVCHVLKRTPEELINEYPKKEKEIMEKLGIQRKTPKQMTQELAIRKVWVTHYGKDNKPQEGVVTYLDNLVLEKMRNPHYLYASKQLNLFKYPRKPFIFGNLVNTGTHMVDSTTPLEQASPMQEYLMRRGRQIAENADKANGVIVISTKSGLTKDDGQNLTGDPNQKLFVDDEDGQGVDALVKQIQAQNLPQYVMLDKQDARTQVGNLMGAPTDFTGSQADDGDPTLGEVMIKKNQAAGRQDLMVRAMTRMNADAYRMWLQMALVWYTDTHSFTYDAGDGDIDIITLKRGVIPQSLIVKASKPANPDRSRIEAIVLKLLEQKAISLLDAYKLLQLDNAQQMYDNWAKSASDPMALARDALDVVDDSEAYVAFHDIMAGNEVEEKDNPTKEYVLSLRKLMINDTFLKAKKSAQNRFIKYVIQCLNSLEERLALEEASEIGGPSGEGLRPGTPLPDPTQPLPQPGAPGMTPPASGMPLPPGAPGPMQAGPGMPMPPQGMPAPGPMTASSVFNGTPVPAPGQAPQPMPGNPASLPMV